MTDSATPRIVGVRFSKVGKIYHFDARKIEAVRPGDVVVVETSRGWQLGEVVVIVEEPVAPPEGTWKALDRLATPKDLMQRQNWQAKELDVVEAARKRARELKLQNVKIVFSEYSYDGSKLTNFFSSDSEERVDLKSLRGEMQRNYNPAQVEMRQIGPRDVAKVIGGMGACGLETPTSSEKIIEWKKGVKPYRSRSWRRELPGLTPVSDMRAMGRTSEAARTASRAPSMGSGECTRMAVANTSASFENAGSSTTAFRWRQAILTASYGVKVLLSSR